MSNPEPSPASMSQAELEEYLDALVRAGADDSPEFHAAYNEWSKRYE